MTTEPLSEFSELGISPAILKAIAEMGFEAPTRIQASTIPSTLSGRDVAGQAQTGTGKTAAFAIPLLERITTSSKSVQALVLCPTRELAVQITGEMIKLGSEMENIQITPIYGGQPIGRQIRQLKSGSQVVVGTPGRVMDHLGRGTLSLNNLEMVVLDEADEMLNMGFREDIETILGYTDGESRPQTIMFSATISPAIKRLMKTWFKDPEMISVKGGAIASENVEQYLLEVRDSVRTDGICRLIDMNDFKLTLVFCNTRRECDRLVSEMQSRGFASDALHGEMNQSIRDKVMRRFRTGEIDVLIATDVAARGLDVEDVSAVFNYDIPQDPEYYVHRIGRTGRAGRKGVAYTFTSGRKKKGIRFIEKQLGMKLKSIPLPTAKEVESLKMDQFFETVVSTLEGGGLRPWIEQIEAAIPDHFSPVEVAAALLKLQKSARSEEQNQGKTAKASRPDTSGAAASRSGFRRGGGGKSGGRPERGGRAGRKAGSRKGRHTGGYKRADADRGERAGGDYGNRPKTRSGDSSGSGSSGADHKAGRGTGAADQRNRAERRRPARAAKDKTQEPFYTPYIKKKSKKFRKRNRG